MHNSLKIVAVAHLLLGINSTLYSQKLVSPAGESSTNSSVDLEWSIGDLVTELVSTSGIILSQGYNSAYEPKCNYSELFIPNVITPNDDKRNECFVIDNQIRNPEFSIYNRWGKLIYMSHNYANDWSGEEMTPGAYYYSIKDECGNEFKGVINIIK